MIKGLWHKLIRGQYGGISPFMFGLLIGVSIFSISMQKRADIETDEVRKKQLQRQELESAGMRKAVELAIMTENAKSEAYAAIPDDERIARSLSHSTGKTRTGQDIKTRAATAGDYDQYGRIIISTADDAYTRDALDGLKGSFGEIGGQDLQKRADTTVVDTTSLRHQQISISYKNMEALAGMVYNWWSTPGNGFVFPTIAQFNADIAPLSRYNDFWRNAFAYTRHEPNRATLSFVPPWGGDAYVLTLDMTASVNAGLCGVQTCSGKGERWVSDPHCLCTSCPGGPDKGEICPPAHTWVWSICDCFQDSYTTSSGPSSTSSGSSEF